MSARRFASRQEAKRIFTTSKVTTNFRHLLPVAKPKHIVTPNPLDKSQRAVSPKDRIKWWNIVPGDQVRVMAETDGSVREVKGVNKFTNRVYIEGDKKRKEFSENDVRSYYQIRNPYKNVHYSGLQLYIGTYDFPPEPGSSEPQRIPVFAKRIGTSGPEFKQGRFVWERYATATTPRLPTWTPGSQDRIHIPWPEPEKPNVPKPTNYDTGLETILEVTYSPTCRPPAGSNVPLLREGGDDTYVRMLRGELPYKQNVPMEVFLSRELSNPHSREKKRERYLAAKERQRNLLRKFIDEEMKKTVDGRSRKEAVAEATFRWREQLRLERKAELKKRWVARGLQARLERRRKRRAAKQEAERQKLRDLVLRVAPNQIMPQV